MTIEQSAVIPSLEMYLSEVTPAHIAREGRKMDSPTKGEQSIGPLTSEIAQKLYCASKMVGIKAVEAKTRAEQCTEDDEEKQLLEEHEQLKELTLVLRHMLWYEVHSQVAHWGSSIGLRKDWTVVKCPDNEPPEIIKRLMGGLGLGGE
jgi:hypothetical protein